MAGRPGSLPPFQLTQPNLIPFPFAASASVSSAVRPRPRVACPQPGTIRPPSGGISTCPATNTGAGVTVSVPVVWAGGAETGTRTRTGSRTGSGKRVGPDSVPVVGVPVPAAVGVGAQALDEAIKDDELDLELNAVDAGLKSALQVEEVGALDAEERGVEGDDQQVRVDEVVQHLVRVIGAVVVSTAIAVFVVVLVVATTETKGRWRRRRGERRRGRVRLVEQRAVA